MIILENNPGPVNVCVPDFEKSCACCCGLYNIKNATRGSLHEILDFRTQSFSATERTLNGIEDFKACLHRSQLYEVFDPEIYVCEFAGFIDKSHKVVGCMLHPINELNGGIDLRGLCHYGSMACKSFFCPAWKQIPDQYRQILNDIQMDWHLYGLVATDVDFIISMFRLLELQSKHAIPSFSWSQKQYAAILDIFNTKENYEPALKSKLRIPRYYCHGSVDLQEKRESYYLNKMIDCISFNYGMELDPADLTKYLTTKIEVALLALFQN